MAENLTAVPSKFTAGETVEWVQSVPDYAAPTWVMSTVFINSAAKFTVTATASGSDHLSTISASTSGGLTAGIYQWQQKVTDGTEVHLVDSGSIEVLKNFAATALLTFDSRSHVKKVFDALEAVIENRASEDHLSMSISGRSISKMSHLELEIQHRSYEAKYKQELKAAALARGEVVSSKVRIRHWV